MIDPALTTPGMGQKAEVPGQRGHTLALPIVVCRRSPLLCTERLVIYLKGCSGGVSNLNAIYFVRILYKPHFMLSH